MKVAVGPRSNVPPPSPWINADSSMNGVAVGSYPAFVKVVQAGTAAGNNVLWVCVANSVNCASGTHGDEILGNVNLNSGTYVAATVVFNATYSWDPVGMTMTVTLGSCVSGCPSVTTGGSSTAIFQPKDGSGTVTDNGVHF